ncbi:hypothetical protein JCM3775_004353 [Rhodotorula graminis]|uniref:Methyltransferase type 11 domain-containing protein n=1 Tax=Rhodotorula graminis (strain WP1) TaxID=578459 RepID=A0A194SBI8_RHOGW|nr:uncharacterized protein RHOBADRAFT_32553 [Rhodotorula graminis WP1]KPV77962.1 hypothetical protein RHOBADRAFT_32553 [Rhodotorula graminis WP1]
MSSSTLARTALRQPVRRYAVPSFAPSSASPFAVFDRDLKRNQRNRAARHVQRSRLTDYVKDDVAQSMVDRLLDIKRRYPLVLDVGSGPGFLAKHLDPEITQKVVMVDGARQMLYRDEDVETEVPVERVHLDEEELASHFEENSHDCIMSCLSMHWINDLPGTLVQIKRTLRPDGVFIGSMLGGDTLFELRTSLQLAELEREGGISPRISPMTDSQSVTSLLNRAGFALSTVDVDEVQIAYPSIHELVDDLKWMGEGNAVVNRRRTLSPETLLAAGEIYKELHGLEDGSIPATFQIMHMIGWKPDPSQPKPAKRGSGSTNLADVIGDEGATPLK